jgi:hypothetical protein
VGFLLRRPCSLLGGLLETLAEKWCNSEEFCAVLHRFSSRKLTSSREVLSYDRTQGYLVRLVFVSNLGRIAQGCLKRGNCSLVCQVISAVCRTPFRYSVLRKAESAGEIFCACLLEFIPHQDNITNQQDVQIWSFGHGPGWRRQGMSDS